MKTFARVIEICPIISGTSDNGNDWEKQTIVFETLGLEPMTLAVEFMGEWVAGQEFFGRSERE